MASITSLNAMTRDRSTWPQHKAKARKRKRERRTIAREAQRKHDEAKGRKL